jgi:hypothetical protein
VGPGTATYPGGVFFYRNTGSRQSPTFAARERPSFLPAEYVAEANRAAVAFGDLNGDGLPVSLPASSSSSSSSSLSSSSSSLDVVTVSSPSFLPAEYVAEANRGDDGDDDDDDVDSMLQDLVGTDMEYATKVWLNQGTAASPLYTTNTTIARPIHTLYNLFDVQPTLVDLDADGGEWWW